MNFRVGILVMNGVHDGAQYEFEPSQGNPYEIRIGRDTTNDIPLSEDVAVSRNHAIIRLQNGEWWIEDLGSKNGTFLGRTSGLDRDDRIRVPVLLREGQLFRVGKTWMRFQLLTHRITA